jgi:hypothetical protein
MEIIEVNIWAFISGFILFHILLILVLLLFQVLKNIKIKNESKNWIYTLNTLLPFFSGIYLVSLLWVFLYSWYGQNVYEFYFFTDFSSNNRVYFFILKLIIPSLLAVLFFFKRFRLNFVFVLIYLTSGQLGTIELLWMETTGDYLASGWETSYTFAFWDLIFQLLLPSLLTFVTYIFLRNKCKLPYPSLFLRNNV